MQGGRWQAHRRSVSLRRTQEALKSGHFVDVLSILLRLQRICNHPGLVAPRHPESSFTAGPLQCRLASLVLKALERDSWKVRGPPGPAPCGLGSVAATVSRRPAGACVRAGDVPPPPPGAPPTCCPPSGSRVLLAVRLCCCRSSPREAQVEWLQGVLPLGDLGSAS